MFTKAILLSATAFTAVAAQKFSEDFFPMGPLPGSEGVIAGWRGSRTAPGGVRGKKMEGGEWGDFPQMGPHHGGMMMGPPPPGGMMGPPPPGGMMGPPPPGGMMGPPPPGGMMMGPHHHRHDDDAGKMCGPHPFLFAHHPPPYGDEEEDFEGYNHHRHHDGRHDRTLNDHHGHHDHDGPHHRGGGDDHHRDGGNPMEDKAAWKPAWEKEYVERMECGADTTACDLRGDDEGFFVCREFDFIQEGLKKSICIPSSRGMEGDQCGCCNGVCPEACTLECEMKDENTGEPTGGMGVLVTFSMPECDPFNMCVPADLSFKMVSHRPFGTCATETLETVYYFDGFFDQEAASSEQDEILDEIENSIEQEDVEVRDSV